jgi:acetate kinase
MSASLRGLDALVFTAGVGEGSLLVRARVAERLAHLGVAVDEERNAAARGEAEIGAAAVRVLIVPAGEELVIARQTERTLAGGGRPG